MSGEDSPYDVETLEALAAERGEIVAPPGAKERVRARVQGSIAGLDPLGGGPARPAPGGASGHSLLARSLSYALPLLIGGVLGVLAGRATVAPPPPRIVYVDRYVDREAAAPPSAAAPSPVASGSASTASSTENAASPPPRAPTTSTDARAGALAAERALLDVAHTALARGDGDGALVAVARHERRYPAGALAEEREAIAVQALVLTRRFDDARARGARFHGRFPDSLLGSAVDATLGSIPR